MMQGGNAMLMHGFHRWTHLLMAHAETLGLQRDQLDKIDQMLTGHLSKAIRDRAEVQALTVTLKKDLRAEAIDTKNVEKQLQTIHTKTLQMELDGIRLYTQLRNVLTPEQREKMQQTIGTPFPAPWEKVRGGMTCPMMQSGNDPQGTEGSSDEASHH
jgi:Spy/CpxP family protein refolding chaperone